MISTGFDSRVKIQQIISNQLPDFVSSESTKAVDFLKQYYISQEYQGGTVDIVDNLDQYLKVDNLKPEIVVDSTTLSVGIGTTSTTINVNSTKGFPNTYGLFKIDDEIITYTGSTPVSFTGCIRGFSGITSYHAELNEEELVFSSTSADSHTEDTKIQNLSSLFLKEFFKKQKYSFTPGLEDVPFAPDLNVGSFIKEARSLYESKGTDESFRILFNALYGETPSIVNLENYLIKPSAAEYVRREVAIAEVLSGDPLKLVGQTLFKEDDILTNAPISEVEAFSRIGVDTDKNKQYFKISFFIGYDDNTPTIQGNFKITPSSRALENVSIGASTISVDSTVGFGTTGVIISGINTNIQYTSKSVNQFYGCTGITSSILLTDSVRNNEVYYGYENGDITKKVILRLNGVISNFNQISKYVDIDEGQLISVKNLGDLIKNPSNNRSYKQIFANSLIYNTSVRYQVDDDSTFNGFSDTNVTLYQNIDRSSLKEGDKIDVLLRGSNTPKNTGSVIANNIILDPSEWWRTKTNKLDISSSGITAPGKYDLRRKINHPFSNGTPLLTTDIISDVQNVYIDSDNTYFYIASNSLPSYGPTDYTNTFTYPITANILSSTADTLKDLTTASGIYTGFKYSVISFDKTVPFFTGDEVTYSVSSGVLPYVGLETGNSYYVGISSGSSTKKEIKLYQSRALINDTDYIKLETQSGSPDESGHNFTLTAQKSSVIGPKKIFKKFPINTNTDIGTQEETTPGTTGMLINGVEIINYKSNDKIYYGPLSDISVLNGGEDYDIINLPKLDISAGVGTTALAQAVGEGTIVDVLVDPQGFDIGELISININGGNGDAVLEPLIISKSRAVEFNGNTFARGGGISTSLNTVTFLTDHGFRNQQELIYESNGRDGIGVGVGTSALVDSASYYSRVLDNKTIKLFTSLDDSISGLNTITFNGNNTTGIHEFKTLPEQKSLIGLSVIDGGKFTNRKLPVDYTGISSAYDTITFKNHGFNHGDKIVYSSDGTPITGLSTANQYSIIKIDNDTFKLANAGIGGTITSNFDSNNYVDFTDEGVGYQNFAYPDISVSVSYSPVGIGTTTQVIEEIKLTPIVKGKLIDAYLYDSGTGYGSTVLNFEKKPVITIKNGKDGSLEPIIVNGKITGANIQFGGSEYYSTPILDIIDSSGSGSGAQLRPIITNNKITDIKVVKTGIGYSSTDTSINVVSSGKNCVIEGSIRSLTVDISKKYNTDQEILLNNGNTLSYSVCGYGETISKSFGENLGVGVTIPSKIIGWAYDGNPIYGPFGYSDPEIADNPRRLVTGYTKDTSNIVDRPLGFVDGFFVDDYKFTNTGDLDENNGRFAKTPEFPNGVYAYHATIQSVGFSSIPQFPYFIGNSYRSPLIYDNTNPNVLNQNFDFQNSNLVRNTFPYRVSENNIDNDFIIETSELERQKIEVESITTGSVSSLSIIDSGDNYKIDDSLIFDEDDTDGTGLISVVSSIKGKDINYVSTASSIYENKVVTWNPTGVVVHVPPSHDWKSGDQVVVSGVSTELSNIVGYYKIGVSSITSTLTYPMIPTSSGGISTEIYVSTIPENVSIGSSVVIGSETVELLNIFKNEKILRVGRSNSGTAHTATTPITFLPDSFTINKITNNFNSKINKKFYFNPQKTVGFGNTAGDSYRAEFTFGNARISRDIPTKSIYAPNHSFTENQRITYSKPVGTAQIVISDQPSSSQYNLPANLYISNLSTNTIGIKTGIGTTGGDFTDVFFRSGGENNSRYLFETNETQQTAIIEKFNTTVGCTTYHDLVLNDNIELDVQPNLSVGIGTTTSVVIKRDLNDGYILVDPFTVSSANCSAANNTFTIGNHKLKTGDKLYYSTGSSYPTGLSKGAYFVYVVDSNTINLCKTYDDSISIIPNIITWSTSPSVTHTFSKVNPEIEIIKNNSIVFDVTDSSLQNYNLSFYYDKDFKNEFVSTATTAFNIDNIGTVGVGTTSRSILSYNSQVPDVLYYNLKRSGFISTSDTSVANSSKIKFVDSYYNTTYPITGVGDTTFTISLKESPEKLLYNKSDCDLLTYATSSLTAKGGIDKVNILASGSGYKKLPTFVGSSSTEGSGGYVIASANEVGNVNTIRILNEGFEYSVDSTLRPVASISPTIVVNNSNTIGIITITNGGSNYIDSPNVVIINSTTREQINSGLLKANLSGSTISNIDIISPPRGLPDIPVELFTTNNTNGVGIKTMMSNNSGIFTCWINTPLQFVEYPFSVGDDVYIEGIVSQNDGGSGFNSEDYGYKFGKVTEYDTSGLDDKVTINLAGITTNTGIGITNQNSLATLINKKIYPEFNITQTPDTFIIGEQLVRNSVILDLIIIKSNNDFIKIFGNGELFKGDIVRGRESGVIATIADITENIGNYKVSFAARKSLGWTDDIGKLSEDNQVTPDNDYYQNLSYTIKSSKEFTELRSPVSALVHTSGLKNFADVGIGSTARAVGKFDVNLGRIGASSTDFSDSVQDIVTNKRVDTVYNFDTAFDLSDTGLSSKFIRFGTKRLSDYLESSGNQVLIIDNINPLFSNLESAPSEYLDIIKIDPNIPYQSILFKISNLNKTDVQLSELVVLNNGTDTASLITKFLPDEESIGKFEVVGPGGDSYIRFTPLPNPYDYDYDLKSIKTEFDSINGIGTQSVGFVRLTGSVGVATTSITNPIGVTTTSIIEVDKNHFKSFHLKNQIINNTSNEMNYIELYITHDGTNTYISEYFIDTHQPFNTLSSEKIGSFNGSISGSTLSINYENDLEDEVTIKSDIVGIGTTTVGIGTYRFKTPTQPDGAEQTALYQSNYNVGIGTTVVFELDKFKFDAAKSIVEVSAGSTKALHQVMLTHDSTDVYVQQAPYLSVGGIGITDSQLGIGTFSGEFGVGDKLILKFHPTDVFGGELQVSSLNLAIYTAFDALNLKQTEDLRYGRVKQDIGLHYYNALNGDRINRIKFPLTFNGVPIFAKSVNPNSVGLNSVTGVFSIPDHYFRTDEELIYTPSSTFVGIGSTPMQYQNGTHIDELPSTVYAIRNDADSFQISTTRSGVAVTFVSLGEGNSHRFEMAQSDTKAIITIDNLIQSPLAFSPINHTLQNNIVSVLGSTGIGTTSTIFSLSGISSLAPDDLLKVDNEYMKIIDIGIGDNVFGPITGIGTTSLIEVERGFVGTSATAHTNTTTARVYKGSYRIEGEDIYFTEPPRGNPQISKTSGNLEFPTSDFTGRVFLRSNYDTNQIYDDISGGFSGIDTSFTLKVGGANTVGLGTTGGNGLLLINNIFQSPTTENNPDNNFKIIEQLSPTGITSVQFTGISTDIGDTIVINESDINENQLPRGGVIISLGSTSGLGYAPLDGARVYPQVGAGGTLLSIVSTASTGPANAITTAKYNNENGILEITTQNDTNFELGIVDQVKLAGLEFTCTAAHAGVTTTIFPEAAVGLGSTSFDYSILDVIKGDYKHKFVDATNNAVNIKSGGSGQLTPNGATYNPTTGLLELSFASNHGLATGATITLDNNSLTFTCDRDNHLTETSYPRPGYAHTFVSGVNNSITRSIGGTIKAEAGTLYDGATGIMTVTSAGHGLSNGNTVTLANGAVRFTCAKDAHATQHNYPRAGDPISGIATVVTKKSNDTFEIFVGKSGLADPISGITTAIKVLDSKTFSINVGSSPTYRFITNVGTSTIPHTYVGGGTVMPWYGRATHGSAYRGNTISIGITDTEYEHRFVKTLPNSVHKTNWSGTTITPTSATYIPSSGDLIFNSTSHGLSVGNFVGIVTNSITFTCSKDDHKSEHSYPRVTDPVAGILTAVTAKDDYTFTVNVGSSIGKDGVVNATVGAGGTLTFAISNPGINYNQPKLIIPEPSYAGLGITGVSRLDVGATTDSGTGLLLNVEVSAASTVGVGSTLFGVNKWEIERPGYAFRRGDVFKIVGLVTERGLANPINEAEFTVLETFTDNFSSWQFGQLDYIDSIKNLQDGIRRRFELRYDNDLLSFDTGDTGIQIQIQNCLLIILNGVIQEPGVAYLFDGGSSFVFTEPPKPEDNVSIYFYRGSPGLDSTLVTDIIPSVKKGDDVQLATILGFSGDNQDLRTIAAFDDSNTVETNIYTGAGISSDGDSRILHWTRQKSDKIVDGEIITKTRGSIEPLIFPTAKIIGNLEASGISSIFIDSENLFGYDAPFTGNFKARIIDNSTSPVSAAITAIVSDTGTISSLDIVSGGSGYVGATTSIIISAPYGVGVGTNSRTEFAEPGISTFAEATGTITNGSITSYNITNVGLGYTKSAPPNVIVNLPTFKTELVANISAVDGFTGIITGIGTTVSSGQMALKFYTRANASSYNKLAVGYPIYISNTTVGTGVVSRQRSNNGTVGIGTTFADNIYIIKQMSTNATLGIITCRIAPTADHALFSASGTESSPVGNITFGRLQGSFSRINPISIGVTGLTIDSGLSTFPTIIRRDEGIRDTGAIDET